LDRRRDRRDGGAKAASGRHRRDQVDADASKASAQGRRSALLEHIIAEARARGLQRLSLETGSGPAFEPALALYRKRGFRDGEPFGGYVRSDFNQFLHLPLARASGR
jgi:GNAT superfamily N-acetyltransferase